MSGLAVVLAGGARADQVVPAEVTSADVVIAADSGLDLARHLGMAVDVVVGDLDSVTPAGLAWARATGIPIEKSSADKDETDLELAIARAAGTGAERIVMLGGAGGRLDHLLANVAVLCGPLTQGIETEAWIGTARVLVVRSRVDIEDAAGSVASLLAWHGAATGVTTHGMAWPLNGARLEAGSALGTSNVVVAKRAGIALDTGVLSVVINEEVS